ncbi:MAG: transporter ATP-binding protein [Mycobacterium sp.]|nr:transporter ATP-binding protein [Mycobacterium sp.]
MTFDPPLAIESGADSIGTGLHVRGVRLTIDGGQTLLDGVSFSARPGTLTAVIGPSGAGKSTLAKVIVGATQPSQGAVQPDRTGAAQRRGASAVDRRSSPVAIFRREQAVGPSTSAYLFAWCSPAA